jgi:hypothetical protein
MDKSLETLLRMINPADDAMANVDVTLFFFSLSGCLPLVLLFYGARYWYVGLPRRAAEEGR